MEIEFQNFENSLLKELDIFFNRISKKINLLEETLELEIFENNKTEKIFKNWKKEIEKH